MSIKSYDQREIREHAERIRQLARVWLYNMKAKGTSKDKTPQEVDFYTSYIKYCKEKDVSIGDEYVNKLFTFVAEEPVPNNINRQLLKIHVLESSLRVHHLLKNVDADPDINYEIKTLMDVDGNLDRIQFHDIPAGKNLVTGKDVLWRFRNKHEEEACYPTDLYIPLEKHESELSLIRVDRKDYASYCSFKSGLLELNAKYNNNGLCGTEFEAEYLEQYEQFPQDEDRHAPTKERWEKWNALQ